MKNITTWTPTKFHYRNNLLTISKNTRELGVGSRLIAIRVTQMYNKYLRVYAKGALVDLGCGKVPLYEAYKEYVTENICVDWENTLHKNELLDHECDLNKPLPLPDARFDTIILSDVLEHIQQPELLWLEMYRVMRPGGNILLNVPFFYGIHEAPYDYFRYTEFALRHFCELAGFEVLELHSIGGSPEVLADFFAKNVSRIPLFGYFIADITQKVVLSLCKRWPVKNISERTKSYFPLGYFLVAKKNA